MIVLFFFNDTATTEIYTLSLHDALPICRGRGPRRVRGALLHTPGHPSLPGVDGHQAADRKSTRLNSSHANISYAVFCLKKKIQTDIQSIRHQYLPDNYVTYLLDLKRR